MILRYVICNIKFIKKNSELYFSRALVMVMLVQHQDQMSFGVGQWKESTRGLCVIVTSWNLLVYLRIVCL